MDPATAWWCWPVVAGAQPDANLHDRIGRPTHGGRHEVSALSRYRTRNFFHVVVAAVWVSVFAIAARMR